MEEEAPVAAAHSTELFVGSEALAARFLAVRRRTPLARNPVKFPLASLSEDDETEARLRAAAAEAVVDEEALDEPLEKPRIPRPVLRLAEQRADRRR